MNTLEFALLKHGGFTPARLGLPDSILEGAGSGRLSIQAGQVCDLLHEPAKRYDAGNERLDYLLGVELRASRRALDLKSPLR